MKHYCIQQNSSDTHGQEQERINIQKKKKPKEKQKKKNKKKNSLTKKTFKKKIMKMIVEGGGWGGGKIVPNIRQRCLGTGGKGG